MHFSGHKSIPSISLDSPFNVKGQLVFFFDKRRNIDLMTVPLTYHPLPLKVNNETSRGGGVREFIDLY